MGRMSSYDEHLISMAGGDGDNAYKRADDALTKAIEDAVNGRGTWEHVQTARHALNQTRRA